MRSDILHVRRHGTKPTIASCPAEGQKARGDFANQGHSPALVPLVRNCKSYTGLGHYKLLAVQQIPPSAITKRHPHDIRKGETKLSSPSNRDLLCNRQLLLMSEVEIEDAASFAQSIYVHATACRSQRGCPLPRRAQLTRSPSHFIPFSLPACDCGFGSDPHSDRTRPIDLV